MSRTSFICINLLILLASCSDLEALGDESASSLSPAVVDSGPIAPLERRRQASVGHGPLALPSNTALELTASVRSHAFELVVATPMQLSVRTLPNTELREVDTLLALTQVGPGSQREHVAHNDDLPGTLFSGLSVELLPGTYELVVSGYGRRTRGGFSLEARCEGCVEPTQHSCSFGSQFGDLRTSAAIDLAHEVWIRSDTQKLSELERAQIVLAVQQSSHSDVTSAAEALSRVDQQEVRQIELSVTPSMRAYTVYEYGVGDNSYGAIFEHGTTEIAASIHDGDLLECTI